MNIAITFVDAENERIKCRNTLIFLKYISNQKRISVKSTNVRKKEMQ